MDAKAWVYYKLTYEPLAQVSSFKSSKNIQKTEGGTDGSVLDNQSKTISFRQYIVTLLKQQLQRRNSINAVMRKILF